MSPSSSSAAPPKVILITGCSSGIGLDAALRFKDMGWQVFATCRSEKDCAKLIKMGLESFRLDYEDEASIEAGFNEAMTRSGGRLDVLFNNGAYGIPAAVEDLPTDALRQIFEANFFGWHHLTRLALPVMFKAGGGRVIQNSSVLGFAALKVRGAYNATKFALEGLTDTMRIELHGSGVHMVLVEPGPIRTRIRENSYLQFQKWITWKGTRLEKLYRGALIPRLKQDNPPKDRFELMPDAVTDAVVHAATSTRPRIRYRITSATSIMMVLKRITSSRGFDWIARRV
ncbi:MAG: SDR family NAD(P)-dependent oxidoreductase [Alphaproteobacteria bacterium]|nr:SDR family NAD(P)-dependent oxidoreductase [Alphaproteobacteria bacterium]